MFQKAACIVWLLTFFILVHGGVKNLLNQFQVDFDAGINRDSGYI